MTQLSTQQGRALTGTFAYCGAIGLKELNDTAALMTRVDRKYLVPRDSFVQIARNWDDTTRILEIDGVRGFRYSSVYFDTDDLACFHRARTGRRRRFKVRCRSYVDTNTHFLEVKTRGARGTNVKDRVPIEVLSLNLAGDQGSFVRSTLARRGIDTAPETRYWPVLTSRYLRYTALHQSGSRVTIDEGLTWVTGDYTNGTVESVVSTRDDLLVVETKSGAAPSDVDRDLWRLGHRPTRISKFATGLAAVRPDLPSSRWRRTLSVIGTT